MKFRTLHDPKRSAELRKDITKSGLVPGFEEDGREVLDPRPVSVPVKVRVQGPSPLEQMYLEIRAKERAAFEAQQVETDEEAQDFEVPEDVDELVSAYEEMVQPDVSVLGEALKDRRVYDALVAALEGRYGPLEAERLAEMAQERQQASTIAPTAPSSAPSQAPAGPSMGEPAPDAVKPK